jgi:hypothetical protein
VGLASSGDPFNRRFRIPRAEVLEAAFWGLFREGFVYFLGFVPCLHFISFLFLFFFQYED